MKLAFVHTSPLLIAAFSDLARRELPGVAFFHMLDESLIKNTIEAGGLTEATARRVSAMIALARDGGADAVMVTCSSIGPAVSAARTGHDFPIFRIDEAMAEAAVAAGPRIGVAATLGTTLEPTIALLRDTAAARGTEVTLTPCLIEGAFDAVLAGDGERHDRLVSAALVDLAAKSDVVVLAQASMARVVDALPADPQRAPILSSPLLAVRHARQRLG